MRKPLIVGDFIACALLFLAGVTGHLLHGVLMRVRGIARLVHVTETPATKEDQPELPHEARTASELPLADLPHEVKLLALNDHTVSAAHATHV